MLFTHLKYGQSDSKLAYVCSEETPNEIREDMNSDGMDVDALEHEGRLSVANYDEVYIKNGRIDIPGVIDHFSSLSCDSTRNATDWQQNMRPTPRCGIPLSYAGLIGAAYGIANITRVYLEPTKESQAVSCVRCVYLDCALYDVCREQGPDSCSERYSFHNDIVERRDFKENGTSRRVFYGTNSGCYNPSAGLD